jgi:hypothetical protein
MPLWFGTYPRQIVTPNSGFWRGVPEGGFGPPPFLAMGLGSPPDRAAAPFIPFGSYSGASVLSVVSCVPAGVVTEPSMVMFWIRTA